MAALLVSAPVPAGALERLPAAPIVRPLVADPAEPRTALLVDRRGDRVDGALGGRFPLVAGGNPPPPWGVTLEAGGFLTLGRDGSFFPLRTFDGVFGGALDARRGSWSARLRLLHRSAHKADGDSTAAYREPTYSREFVWVDILRENPRLRLLARAGASWHAVPRDPGPRFAAGLEWRPGGPGIRPVFAAHAETARERGWKTTWSVMAGILVGRGEPALLGLRYHRGEPPQGQYADRRVELLGLEIRLLAGRSSRPGS